MKRDTGSERRTFPSSTSIRMATPVTGLVIEAMRKMPSFRIGVFDSRSIIPCASKCATFPRLRHDRHAAGDLLGADVALDHLVDPLQPLGGQTNVLRPPVRDGGGERQRDGADQCEDGGQSPAADGVLHRQFLSMVDGRRQSSMWSTRRRAEITESTRSTEQRRTHGEMAAPRDAARAKPDRMPQADSRAPSSARRLRRPRSHAGSRFLRVVSVAPRLRGCIYP